MSHTILLVDDEPNVLDGLRRTLHKEPYEILTATSVVEAAELLENGGVDLIISDEEMPGMCGTEFLTRVARDYPEIVRIVLTGHPTLPTALRAINEGHVYQLFTKPCNEIDLAIAIRRALEQKDLQAKNRELLELTKQQSALIEEAKMFRRLRDHPGTDRSALTAKGAPAIEQRELSEDVDDEVRRDRAAPGNARRSQDDRNRTGESAPGGALGGV
jgi:two-component system probable response regulator PhcQ